MNQAWFTFLSDGCSTLPLQGSQRKIQPTRVPAADIDQRFMVPVPRAQLSGIAATSSVSCVTPTRRASAGATHLGSTFLTPQQGRSLQRIPSGAAFASAARLATAAGFPKEDDRSPAANLERLMAGGDMEARSSPFAGGNSRAERSGRLPLSASIAAEEPLRQPQWPDLGQPSAASSSAATELAIAPQRAPVKAPAAWLRSTHSLPAPGAHIGLRGQPCDVLGTKSTDAVVIKPFTHSETRDSCMTNVTGVEGLRSAPARRVAPVLRATSVPVSGERASESWGAPVKAMATMQGCRQDTISSVVSIQHRDEESAPLITISGRSVLSDSRGGAQLSQHADVFYPISKPSAGVTNAAEVKLKRLPDDGRRLRLAQLHAAVLSSSASAALGTELDVLLHLMALPPGVTGGNDGDAGKRNGPNAARGLLNDSSAAAAYACAVLQNAGAPSEVLT